MKIKRMILGITIFLIIAICILDILFEKESHNVIAKVNGEDILLENLEIAEKEYESFNREELIEALILETLVLQKADDFNITVTQNELDEKMNMVEQMGELINNKILEKYNDMDNYKKALECRMLYEKVRQKVKGDFIHCIRFKDNILEEESKKYILDNNIDNNKDSVKLIKSQYIKNYYDSIFNVYFEVWKYGLLNDAKIEMDNSYFRPNTTPHLNSNDASKIEFSMIPYFYKAYFNMESSKLLKNYDIINVRTIPIKNYHDRYLFLEFENKNNNEKLEIVFDIDAGKSEPIQFSDNNLTQINGIQGSLENNSERNIELNLYDKEMHAFISIKGYDTSKERVIEFMEEFIKVEYT